MNRYTAEPKFDFERNEFIIENGRLKMINGVELLKQKIVKVIKTQINKYKIYDGENYGIDIDSIMGKVLPRNLMKSEVERIVSTALLNIDGVENVEAFEVEQYGSLLNISFKIKSELGEINEEVQLNG